MRNEEILRKTETKKTHIIGSRKRINNEERGLGECDSHKMY